MNEKSSDSSKVTHLSLLTYSTWLVVGVWLIFTGIGLIFSNISGDFALVNFLFGALRFYVGIRALQTARMITYKSNQPQGLLIRFLTFTLLILIIDAPFLIFVFQSAPILFGISAPGDHYRADAERIILIAGCYLLATLFGGWQLRAKA
jgi:hypothetical protein